MKLLTNIIILVNMIWGVWWIFSAGQASLPEVLFIKLVIGIVHMITAIWFSYLQGKWNE